MNRLLIADDHRIFTDGIRFLIEHTTDLEVVGVVHSGQEVQNFLAENPVDIILLDIDLPDVTGFEIAWWIKREYPTISTLALSMLDDNTSMKRMYQAGAKGYCVKSKGKEEVFSAIKLIREGRNYWPGSYLDLIREKTEKLSEINVTDREREVIALICEGRTTNAIAEKLFISTRTVETHRKNIYRKLKVHTNVELINHAKKLFI